MKPSKRGFITIGQILAPWGISGQLKVEVVTDFPQRFAPCSKVYINRQPMNIESTKWHKGKAIIKLDTIDTIEGAQRLQGQPIEIHHSQLQPLPKLEVWTTQGKLVGNITKILTAESNDNYVVKGSEGEVLIPAIEDVVKSIDLNKGCIIIEPIEGLLSLNQKTTNKRSRHIQ